MSLRKRSKKDILLPMIFKTAIKERDLINGWKMSLNPCLKRNNRRIPLNGRDLFIKTELYLSKTWELSLIHI